MIESNAWLARGLHDYLLHDNSRLCILNKYNLGQVAVPRAFVTESPLLDALPSNRGVARLDASNIRLWVCVMGGFL